MGHHAGRAKKIDNLVVRPLEGSVTFHIDSPCLTKTILPRRFCTIAIKNREVY